MTTNLPTRARDRAKPLARTLGTTTAIGLLLGTVVGGIGGRMAMRLLFLTSNDGVRGIESDDGFVIGQVTTETFNLLITGALFGIVGAFTYLGVRPFMIGPLWARALTCGAAAGAVLGALIVNPDGVDFTRLSPLPLAVALFVAIPALFAILTALMMEHALRPRGWASNAPLRLLAAPLLVFLFPPLFVVLAVPTLLVLGARQAGERWSVIGTVMYHRAAFWVARVSWGGIAGLGVIALVEDLRALA